MATQTTPRLFVELAPHSLQLAVTGANGRLEGYGECASDAAAVAAKLAEIAPGLKPANVQVLLVPPAGTVMRAGSEEATSIRTAKGLLAKAATLPNAPASPLSAVALDAVSGLPVEAVGSTPWLLAATAKASLDDAKAQLTALGLPVGHLRLALPLHVGAVVTALQDMPEETRVLVWQVGETDAQLVCVSAAGCEAAGVSGTGFTSIFEAVQAGLGLKFKAAASKLFFNAGYDFTETAGPIAERIAAALRPEIEALGCKPTALHVAGLPVAQSWLAKAVASALEVSLLVPDMTAFSSQCGLAGPAVKADLPSAAMALLLQAAPDETSGGQAWHADWLDTNPVAAAPAPAAPAAPVVPVAPKPAAVKAPPAAPAPAPVIKAPAAPVPVPVPVPVASATKQPAQTMKPAAVATASTPVKAQPVAAPVAQAAPLPPAPVLKPAAATIPPMPAVEPEPAVVEVPAAEVPAAAVAKKKPVALFAAIGAVVVLGGVGAFLMMGKSTPAAAKTPAAAQLSPEDIRMREEENARMLAEELKTPRSFRNDRYSFEVSDRGFLRKLVGVGNRTIIDEFGWLELQGMFTGSTRTFQAGTISDNDYRPTINKTVKDGKVVFEIIGTHPRFSMETVVTCLPKTLQVETVFKPVNMEDARGPISGVYMVKMNRQSLSLGQRATVEPGLVNYATQVGPFSLKFNSDAWGQAGEEGKQTVSVGSNLVFFYFAGGTDPKNNVLRMEVTLP